MIPTRFSQALFLISVICAPSVGAPVHEPISLCDETACLQLLKTEQGIVFHEVIGATGSHLMAEADRDIFEFDLRTSDGKSHSVTSGSGWHFVQVEGACQGSRCSRLAVKLHGPTNPKLEGVSVLLSGKISKGVTLWNLRIQNKKKMLDLGHIGFPKRLPISVTEKNSSALHVHFPLGSGVVKQGPFNPPLSLEGAYPSGAASYQMIGAYGDKEGVFVASLDPSASFKNFQLTGKASTAYLGIDWIPPHLMRGHWTYHLPGVLAIGIHKGNWYDAAQIYRSWAHEKASWTRKQLATRLDGIGFWINCSLENCVSESKRVKQVMEMPIGAHLYSWHQIPMDVGFPHFFPEKPGFKEAVAEMQKEGVIVMPYINARLWDTRLADFSTDGQAASAKDEFQLPVRDGVFAVLCPHSPLWQDLLSQMASRLVQEFHVDGVYLDLLALYGPVECSDRSHSHLPGGGGQWVSGYHEILKRIKRVMQPGEFLTAEGNAEPYSDYLNGLLTWQLIVPDQEPIFPAIYGDRVSTFGRAYYSTEDFELSARMKAAQSLVFGEQIGWIPSPLIKDEKDPLTLFFKRLAKASLELRPYQKGRMLRSLQLTGDIPEVETNWYEAPGYRVKMKTLQAAAWENEGETAIAVVSFGAQEQDFTIELPESLRKGSHTLSLTINGVFSPEIHTTGAPLNLKIPADSVLLLQSMDAPLNLLRGNLPFNSFPVQSAHNVGCSATNPRLVPLAASHAGT